MPIHPTAVIDPAAELDSSVDVGPYAVIEGPVRIGANTRVRAHAFVTSWTRIGENCDIHPFAVVGNLPQDFHFSGARSYCTLGNGVIVREGASIHRGTQPESETTVGDECFLLAQSHVGHNCRLGRGVKLMNLSALGGHVALDDLVTVSALTGVHQFVRVGRLAFLAGGRITMDVPPFMMAVDSTIIQHNRVGMRRADYTSDELFEIRNAYRTLYRSGLTFLKAVARLRAQVSTRAGRELLAFLDGESKRGFCGPGRTQRGRSAPGDAES